MTWAERKAAAVDVQRVEAELREAKRCECGEVLTNDEIGSECPACGQSPADLSDDIMFMSTLACATGSTIISPPATQASRTIH